MTADPKPIDPADIYRVAGIPESVIRKIESGEITPEAAPRDETPEETVERRAKALAARLRLWRPPTRFRDARLGDLTPEQNPGSKVTRWLDEGGQTLILQSETNGNGKSHGLYAIGNEAVYNRSTVAVAWNAVDLVDAIKPNGDDEAYEIACTVPILGIDDLGGERMTEWWLERLGGVVDARWREGLRTVVSMNLTGEQLLDVYGKRIFNRLIDEAWIAVFTGPSRREPLPF